MTTHILRLVLVFALLLPGTSSAAGAYQDDLPNKNYLPMISDGPGKAACELVYQDPPDGVTLRASTSFDARWILRNTGPATWSTNSVTIRFISGDRLHGGVDGRDMPYDVVPGGPLELVIEMTAPATPGSYVSNWAVVDGAESLCSFHVQISVP